ncbi:MAG: VCBS domain-containing protein [Eubacteriales bacterium]
MKKQTGRKGIAGICLLLILISVFSGCAKGTAGQKEVILKEVIVGRWLSDGNTIIIFSETGIGNDDGERFTYEIIGETLTVTYDDGETETVSIKVVGKNHLTVVEENGFTTELYRCDAAGRLIIGE